LPEEWLIERNQQVGTNFRKPLSPSFVALCFTIAAIFQQLALHFRDSRHYQPNTVEDVRLLASVTRIAARLRFPSTSTECNRVKSRQNPVVGQFEN
jgi:hypothetical protein